jgi:GH18 family chitinase
MLTIAGYGRTYRLKNVKDHSIGDEAIGRGNGSKYIKNGYNIPFYEVCDRIKNQNWIKQRNNNEGPFAYKEDQWMSFDDELSALNKAMFVREKGYGGLVIWDITQDDFRGKCANSVFPLVNAVKNGLKVTEKGSNDLYFIIVLIVILPFAIIIGIIIGIFIGFKLQSLRSKKRTVVNDIRQTGSQSYDQIEQSPEYLELK